MSVDNSLMLVIVGAFLLLWIVARQFREKSRRISRLWVMPAIMLYISYAAIEQGFFSTFLGPLLMLPAIVIGGAIGVIRCSRVGMRLGPENGTILLQGSIISVAIWGAMIAIRFFARFATSGVVDTTNMAAIVSALIVLSISNTICYYGYLYVRYLNLVKNNESWTNNIL